MPEVLSNTTLSKLRSILFTVAACLLFQSTLNAQSVISLKGLSVFKDPGNSWSVAGHVTADLQKPNALNISRGSGILVNQTTKKNRGTDLYTVAEYGDVDLELDYLIAAGANSGIYLQGRYEIQLHDTWGSTRPTSGSNGGIYERWNNNLPAGQKGYEGYAPRQNCSRAPGLWQHLKISFKAPVFDASGQKIEPATILRIELNGVVIHENVELSGPTRGAVSMEEKATGPLRFQGDHGSVAFRNITITTYDKGRPLGILSAKQNTIYPILVDAQKRPVFRSFMDLPGDVRVVHAISVASPANVHYTYDADTGMILQVWRGDFLDATPMWNGRGDGSSRPVGAVQRFGKPVLALARLSSPQAAWIKDTTGTGFRPKGYSLHENNQPVFEYALYASTVTDKIVALDNGRGIAREVTIDKPVPGLHIRLAEGATIEEISEGFYLVDDNAYYLRLEGADKLKPVIRADGDKKELIVPVNGSVSYSILF